MNCGGWSVGAGVGFTTSREAFGADMRFADSAGVVMSDAVFEPLSLTMSSPFHLSFFCLVAGVVSQSDWMGTMHLWHER